VTTETPRPSEPTGSGRRRAWTTLALASLTALLLGALGSFLVVRATASTSVADTGADAGFSRDMQTHHRQAVEMAFIIRDRTDDAAVRTLAYDIATSQQQQAGQMYGWLVQWGLPQTAPRGPMAWADEEGMSQSSADGMPEMMPGMATGQQLDELRTARGVEAERIFLRLMIDHHRGGVAMAEAALADAKTPEVRTLAGAIDRAQTTEIGLMTSMLAERT
jgi:uncharacterized protein (DUF305 family)